VIIENDLILISDEVYEAFIYEGEHVCFASLPKMSERTITIGSFSKNYCMTGWRIGYAIAPEKISTAMKVASIATSMGVNTIAQKAALYAMQNCTDNVVNMVNDYKERVCYAADRINKIPFLSCIKPKGSFYIFINISKTGFNSVDFCWKLLEDASVVLIPGISFGTEGDKYVRIACTVPIEKLDEAFNRIEKTLKNL